MKEKREYWYQEKPVAKKESVRNDNRELQEASKQRQTNSAWNYLKVLELTRGKTEREPRSPEPATGRGR
ncbi:hypothetical protein TNCV_1673661 [Trichonephila clavipes]|nr:hypothetical protein TNCV_1673661 [Trichonephila clavipes]